MIEHNQLLQTYIRQYREASRKKRRSVSRPRDYRERLTRMMKNLKRTKASQVTSRSLEDWHRQLKNMAYFAYRSNDSSSIQKIETSLIPELCRLDLTMFMPSQQDDISLDFLDYMETEMAGELCTRPLLELYQTYKRYVIEYKIMDLVPSRPELEFPQTLAMSRRFILHIGPTNSGKTFHALERLKLAGRGIYLGPLRLLALEVYEKMQEYGVPCTMLTGQECIADENSRITASTIEMADFSQEYDIAVIDEAQLTADPDRQRKSRHQAGSRSRLLSGERKGKSHGHSLRNVVQGDRHHKKRGPLPGGAHALRLIRSDMQMRKKLIHKKQKQDSQNKAQTCADQPFGQHGCASSATFIQQKLFQNRPLLLSGLVYHCSRFAASTTADSFENKIPRRVSTARD